jgi:hypothetical protein
VRRVNGSLIIYRVAHFRNYLLRTLGKPTIDKTSPYNANFHLSIRARLASLGRALVNGARKSGLHRWRGVAPSRGARFAGLSGHRARAR